MFTHKITSLVMRSGSVRVRPPAHSITAGQAGSDHKTDTVRNGSLKQSSKQSRRSSRTARYLASYIVAMVAFAPIVAPVLADGARAATASYTCALDRFAYEGTNPAGSARDAEYRPGGLCDLFS